MFENFKTYRINALCLLICFATMACVAESVKLRDQASLLVEIEEDALTTIAFGSCLKSDLPMPIWNTILSNKPDLFVFAGDNVYVDSSDPAVFKKRYDELSADPDFINFRKQVPIIATWDDHDFGRNDGGGDFSGKDIAAEAFYSFFQIPVDSPRRKHKGIYDSAIYGPEGRRVQIVLLDTRYFRDPLLIDRLRTTPKKMYYKSNPNPHTTLLGTEQWAWLEQELLKKADLRIIVSSIQFLPTLHKREKWGNMPAQRQRLLDYIRDHKVNDVVIVSGDRHYGRFYKLPENKDRPYPLFELTTSNLNRKSGSSARRESDPLALTDMYRDLNYGLFKIDWEKRELRMQLRELGPIVLSEFIYKF